MELQMIEGGRWAAVPKLEGDCHSMEGWFICDGFPMGCCGEYVGLVLQDISVIVTTAAIIDWVPNEDACDRGIRWSSTGRFARILERVRGSRCQIFVEDKRFAKEKKMTDFVDMQTEELEGIRRKHRPIVSTYEAEGLIREEFDDLWEVVKTGKVDDRMLHELVQIAARCQRAAEDLGLIGR